MRKRATKTGFDKFVGEQMRSPSFARAYAEARAEVDEVDRIVRGILDAIDAARLQRGMKKAELARAAGMREEIVRRLLTAKETPNPTLETVVRMMLAVGRTLSVVQSEEPRAKKRTVTAVAAKKRAKRVRADKDAA